MSWTLACMEWRRLMRSPMSWTLMACSLFLLSLFFLHYILETYAGLPPSGRAPGLTVYLGRELFGFAALLILLLAPVLTMRPFSEAFRNGSYVLLSSAPVSIPAILFGKYLGVLLFQLFFILTPLLLSLTLIAGTQLDYGLLAAATLGLALVSACFSAIGVYFSTLNESPAAAAGGSYGVLLLLSILGQDALGSAGGLLHWFAWPAHYLNLQQGLMRSGDLAYFLLLTGLFLGLSLHQLDRRRSR